MAEFSYRERIRQKLEAALAPLVLEIADDSARHAGHSGHDPRGETHFKIRVVSTAFTGLDRLARHRLVYAALAVEMQAHVHAVVIDALSPPEYNHR